MQYLGHLKLADSRYFVDKEPINVAKKKDLETGKETVIGKHEELSVVNRMISEARKDDRAEDRKQKQFVQETNKQTVGSSIPIEIHETPKHAPPRHDLRKHFIDEEDDPMKELNQEKEKLASVRVAAGMLDAFDVNDFSDKDADLIVERASEFVDQMILEIEPYIALRAALDQTIFYGLDGTSEFSFYNLIGSDLYDVLLAKLADKFGHKVQTNTSTPFKLRDEVHLNGIDLIEGARSKVSSLIDDLVGKQKKLKDQIDHFDDYLHLLQGKLKSTELSKQQAIESLKHLENELGLEIKKLTNYQDFLKDSLHGQIGKVFEGRLGGSPLNKINFDGAENGKDHLWDLKFQVSLQETFDSDMDRRFEVDSNGIPHCLNSQEVLTEAAEKFKRNIKLIKVVFERFLGGSCTVETPKKVRGQFEGKRYNAECEFIFNCQVPVKNDDDIRKAVQSISQAMEDLTHSEYGRLAALTTNHWRNQSSN